MKPDAERVEVHAHADPLRGKVGMWLFLLTEVMLFGTLFLIFANYYARYPLDYHAAARELDRRLGGLNTIVLLTSSLTMVLAVAALRRDRAAAAVRYLAATLGCALIFLVVKAVEWGTKFAHGLVMRSPTLVSKPQGEIVFFGEYFLMTGLHALHVLIGIGLITVTIVAVRRRQVRAGREGLLENVGLYWHIVDIIWIYLFPLFYLAGR